VTLPTKMRTRGRPKGTDRSLNRKYGITGSTKRKRNKVSEAIDESICYLCLSDEPDKSTMKGSTIDWIDCSNIVAAGFMWPACLMVSM